MHAEADSGRPIADVEREAVGILRKIAADTNYTWLAILDVVLDRAWSRLYADIVIDREGLAKLRRAARKGAVVLVPSHKSHIDYLLLSQIFFKEGLMPPHIAAGENLNFPPMGMIMRRGGAFFMKRSFRGDRLYGVVFAAYVRRLLKEGHTIEFFIEGGRSRTGRLLAPRLGMLGMCVDPILDGSIHDVSFIPVHIGYGASSVPVLPKRAPGPNEDEGDDLRAPRFAREDLPIEVRPRAHRLRRSDLARVFAASRGSRFEPRGHP